LGEHGKFNKGRPYETSAGIPFIIRYPAKIQNGMIIQNAYSSVDCAPTILKLMGVDHPGVTFQGVDATPEIFISDQRVTDGDRITFTYDNQNTTVWAAAVMSRYKLVVSRSDVPWLFHYSKDPDEMIKYLKIPNTLVSLRNSKLHYSMEWQSTMYLLQARLVFSSGICQHAWTRQK